MAQQLDHLGYLNHSINNSINASIQCDVLRSDSSCSIFLFVNNFVIMAFLSLIGICGNTVSIVALHKDSKRNVTSYMLLVLAVSDTGFLLVSVFTKQAPVLCTYFQTQNVCMYRYYVWPYVMKYGFPLTMWFFILSIWTTCLVTIHRAIAVITPHKAKEYGTLTSVHRQTFLLTILSFVISIPRFFEFEVNHQNGCPATLHATPLSFNRLYNIAYKNVTINIFVNIGPLVILSVLTWQLIKEIREAIRQRRIISRQGMENHQTDGGGCQLTIVLLLVVVVFIFCQTPHVVYVLARVLLPRRHFDCKQTFFYFFNISDTLVVLNSAVNFFLYCMAGKRFRQHLKMMCYRTSPPTWRSSTTTRDFPYPI